MSFSRREFVARLAATGAAAALPVGFPARAEIHPPLAALAQLGGSGAANLRIGYAAITWSGHNTQAIDDISSLGYSGIQLLANATTDFPDPHRLRDLLAQHNLTFVALSSGTAPLDPAQRQDTIERHAAHAKYLHEAGGLYLQVIGAGAKDGQSYTEADYRYEGELLTEIGKRAAGIGVQTGFHNHMHTIGQTPQAVAAILAASDPQYVKFELDVAHYLQGGGDPAAAIHTYAGRLLFMHLKDVRNAQNSNGYEFVELGHGRVNFPAIFAALTQVSFSGWGIVELDAVPLGANRTPKQCAAISQEYLERIDSIQGLN